MNVLLDQGNFLSTDRVLKWMEGVITKALKAMEEDENGTYVDALIDKTKPNEAIRIYVSKAYMLKHYILLFCNLRLK